MNTRLLFLRFGGILTLLALLVAVQPRHAGATGQQVIVRLRSGASLTALNQRYGTTTLGSGPGTLALLRLSDPSTLSALRSDPEVVFAEVDGATRTTSSYELVVLSTGEVLPMHADGEVLPMHADGQTAPSAYSDQWGAKVINLRQAQQAAGGRGVVVAVLDTGVEKSHGALKRQLVAGWDFVDGDNDPAETRDGLDQDGDGLVDESMGHGTHVAGIVALTAPNAAIMPVRVLDDDGLGSYYNVIRGIYWAVDNGAKVVNMSLSGPVPSQALSEAVDYATSKGVVLVGAAGPESGAVHYPAAYPAVIAVGAIDSDNRVASFARFTPNQVDVYAPGVRIVSSYANNNFIAWSGTSMAAPFVAGEAAMLRQIRPNWPVKIFHDWIRVSIKSVNPGYADGRGRIDVNMAVKSAPR